MPRLERPTDPVITNINRETATTHADEFGRSNRRMLYRGDAISHFELDDGDSGFFRIPEAQRQLKSLTFYGSPSSLTFRQLTHFGLAGESAEKLGGYLEMVAPDLLLEQSAIRAMQATIEERRERYIGQEMAAVNEFIRGMHRQPWLIVDSQPLPEKRGEYPANYAVRHWLAPLVRVELNGENILESIVRRNDDEEATVTGRTTVFTSAAV